MITYEELKAEIAKAHNPELAKQPGSVWQIWEDGELTLQKSGDLLWSRTLHCMRSGCCNGIPKEIMPEFYNLHGYAFIASEEVGTELRLKMLEYCKSKA